VPDADADPSGRLSFDAATAVRRRGNSTSSFEVDIPPLWTVGDKPNGGVLLAMLGRAALRAVTPDHDEDRAGGGNADRAGRSAATDAPVVLAATATYLAAPTLTPATVEVTVLRQGRTVNHARAVLQQERRTLVDTVFVMGFLPSGGIPRHSDLPVPHPPQPEDCMKLGPQMPEVTVGILEATDIRVDPATALAIAPAPGAPATVQGWVRFADGRPPDALSLIYFVDAMPPAAMRIGSTGWVPTLSMSVYARAHPAPGWLCFAFTAHHVDAGMVDESCTLWDSTGRVVAQATQLARLRFRDEEVGAGP
jgi:hypothetical protein